MNVRKSNITKGDLETQIQNLTGSKANLREGEKTTFMWITISCTEHLDMRKCV